MSNNKDYRVGRWVRYYKLVGRVSFFHKLPNGETYIELRPVMIDTRNSWLDHKICRLIHLQDTDSLVSLTEEEEMYYLMSYEAYRYCR